MTFPIVGPAANQKIREAYITAMTTAVNNHETRITTLENTWTSYGTLGTILTATVTPPTMGNSTLNFASYILLNAKTCKAQGKFTLGSTFSAGSGTYRVLLPFNADTSRLDACVGNCLINDSGTALRGCTARLATATTFDIVVDSSNLMVNNGGSGTAWAAGDWISWDVTYGLA